MTFKQRICSNEGNCCLKLQSTVRVTIKVAAKCLAVDILQQLFVVFVYMLLPHFYAVAVFITSAGMCARYLIVTGVWNVAELAATQIY